MSLYDTLADAYEALLTLTPRVLLPDHPMPEGDEPFIAVYPISSVDRARYGSRSQITRIQVNTWGANYDQVFVLHEQARELLLTLRYRPDGGGQLTDPETSLVGWRADYRRPHE